MMIPQKTMKMKQKTKGKENYYLKSSTMKKRRFKKIFFCILLKQINILKISLNKCTTSLPPLLPPQKINKMRIQQGTGRVVEGEREVQVRFGPGRIKTLNENRTGPSVIVTKVPKILELEEKNKAVFI